MAAGSSLSRSRVADPAIGRAAVEALEGRRLMAADLVADLVPGGRPSDPTQFATVGGVTYFAADDGVHGRELWRTDGTAAGTSLVKDIRPGATGSAPMLFIDFNGTLLFAADVPGQGYELWRSDGTAAGTVLVKDINPGSEGSQLNYGRTDDGQPPFAVVGGTLYFRAFDAAAGSELWRTDGTAAGTSRVADIVPGTAGSYPSSLTAMGGKVYFAATTPAANTELWSSDGSAAGTAMVADLMPGNLDSELQFMAADGDALYFGARTPQEGSFRGVSAFYRSDGTAAGTTVLRANLEWDVTEIVAAGGKVLFRPGGNSLYASDGTPEGTAPLTAGGIMYGQSAVSVGGGRFVFIARTPSDGFEPYVTDGTDAGTFRLADVRPGTDSSGPTQLFAGDDGKVYFVADDGGPLGKQLWRTDGTTAGTVRASAAAGIGASFVSSPPVRVLADGTVLLAFAGTAGKEPHRLDAAGVPQLVKDVNAFGVGSNPTAGGEVNGYYVFPTSDGRLWRTDGTAAGTVTLKQFEGLVPSGFVASGGTLYFRAPTAGRSGRQLWKTDGTAAGTVAVTAPGNFEAASDPVVAGGTIVLVGYNSTTGHEVYRLDPATDALAVVKDLYPGNPGSTPTELTSVGDLFYFVARASSSSAAVLWVSDGTAAGTAAVTKDDGSTITGARELTNVDGTLYFFDGGPQRLYKVAPSAAGSAVVVRSFSTATTAGPDRVTSVPTELTAAGGVLYFAMGTAGAGRELWRSDGTAAGTAPVADLEAGPSPFESAPTKLTASGGSLYFSASVTASGRELWRVDGPTAAPVLVVDRSAGVGSSMPDGLFDADGVLYFTATDADGTNRLWATDATAGTTEITTPTGGAVGAAGGTFGLAAGTLYFTGGDAARGAELWSTTDRVPRRLRAEAGGPYANTEGQSVTLTAFGSTGDVAAYEWDFDYDGTFGADAAGFSTAFPGRDGPSVHTVALRVTGTDGATRVDTATVRVSDVKPTVRISGPESVTEGSPYTLSLSAVDPGEDTVSSWTIEWGDGSVQHVDGNPPSVDHVYVDGPLSGPIFATATNEDGTFDVTAAGVAIGSADPTFGGGDGLVSAPYVDPHGILRLPDGKVVVSGSQGLVRLLPDGTVDTTFGTGGTAPAATRSPRAHRLADGSLLAGTTIYTADGQVLRELTLPSQRLDFLHTVDATTVAPDGSFYVAGHSRNPTSGADISETTWVQHVNADGTPDLTYGVDGTAMVLVNSFRTILNDLTVTADGRVIGGGTRDPDWDASGFAFRLLPGGAIDTSYGAGGFAAVGVGNASRPNAFAFADDGGVLVVGAYDQAPHNYPHYPRMFMVRLTPGGTPDPTFGTGGSVVTTFRGGPSYAGYQQAASATSVAVHPSGRIVVGGHVDGYLVVLRYDAAGRLDPSWGDAGIARPMPDAAQAGYATAVAFQPDGKLLFATQTVDASGRGNGTAVGRLVFSPLIAQVEVENVAPDFDPGGDSSTPVGGELSRDGTFADPGRDDTWTGTVDYGDGTGTQPLALTPDAPASASFAAAPAAAPAGGRYALRHAYAAPGTYTVSVTIRDDDGGSRTRAFATTVTGSVPPVTRVVPAAFAAHVRDGSYAGTNYGSSAVLEVRKSSTAGNQREGYLRFDLSTVGSASLITSAKVRVYGKLSAAGSVPVGLYAVSSSAWTEAGVKWSNKPAAAATAIGTAKTVGSTTAAWFEFDVTSHLKAQKSAGATSVSFALKATAATTPWASFNSDEATANRPELKVVQNPPPPTPQALVVSSTTATVAEGKTASVTVKLAAKPAANVTVAVARTAGDGDLTAGPLALTFTPANWSTAQSVTLSAAQDADAANGSATFSVTSAGLAAKTLTATEADDDVIRAAADGYARDGSYAATKYGAATVLEAGKSATAGGTREAFLRFDLSTAAATVGSAKLRLYGKASGTAAAGVSLDVFGSTNVTWSESTATWSSKPAASGSARGSLKVVGTTAKWYEVDLTAYVKAERAAGRKVVTLVLKGSAANALFASFNADEATSNRPVLVVTG